MPLPNQDSAEIAARRARLRAHNALQAPNAMNYLRSVVGPVTRQDEERADVSDVPFSELLTRLTPAERARYDELLAIDGLLAIDENTVTDIPTESTMPTITTTSGGTTTVIEPTQAAVPFTILPTERPDPYEDTIDLLDIDVAPGTPAPERDLIESIRSLGVLQPISVRETAVADDSGYPMVRYEVIEGARRVLASREVGLTQIHALVFPENTPRHVIAGMTLSANTIRRANPLRELESIETLVAAGADETTISRELHISRQTLQARMRLSRLVPALRAALSDGRIGAAVADLASRLDVNRQNMLVDLLDERAGNARLMDRRITASDVRTLRQARQASAVNALPDSIFTVTRPVPAPIPHPRVEIIRDGVLMYDGMTYYSLEEVRVEAQRVRERRDVIEARLRETITTLERERQTVATNGRINQTNAITQALVEQRDRLNGEFAGRLAEAERRAMDTARSMFATAEIVAAQPAQPTVPAHAPTIAPEAPEEESWASVHRLLIRAQELTPVAPDPQSEHMYQTLEELIAWAARTVHARSTPTGATVSGRTTAPVSTDIMIRGQYRMFDREPGTTGRHFMRYADSNGRLRRRFMSESDWNNQRQIAEQRQVAEQTQQTYTMRGY